MGVEQRLEYAERLIELMGKEIIAYTPRYKKRKAVEDLELHLSIVRGEVDLEDIDLSK